MTDLKLKIDQMSCMHCVNSINAALEKLDGVDQHKVDLNTKSVELKYDSNKISQDKIIKAIDKIGFDAVVA